MVSLKKNPYKSPKIRIFEKNSYKNPYEWEQLSYHHDGIDTLSISLLGIPFDTYKYQYVSIPYRYF